MTAPRFFIEELSGDVVTLTGEEARHAVKVLRIRPGEEITVSDGRGTVVRATVERTGAELAARVTDRAVEPRPRPSFAVYQAIPKHSKLDLVVQKLTELGVDSIHPFPAERSVARWSSDKGASNVARLTEIARQAAKQSRRAWLPTVATPAPVSELAFPAFTLVLHEEADRPLREALPDEPPDRIGLLVGPEGGLSAAELDDLVHLAATPVSLGPLVLRTETAALAAVASILFRYRRLG